MDLKGKAKETTGKVTGDDKLKHEGQAEQAVDKVKETARMRGITSPLHGYCAETLGGLSNGVSPLEMADAYATVASGGYRNRPRIIRKVTFPDGHSELPAAWLDGELPAAVERLERLLIAHALAQTQGNRAETARRLGIHRQLLYKKMAQYGLD